MKHQCKQCGACCSPDFGGPKPYQSVILSDKEIEKIADHLGYTSDSVKMTYAIHSNCINTTRSACTFLKDNQCSIYEVRPACCRAWPHKGVTPDNLGTWIQFCSGLSEGEENDGSV